MVTGSTSPAPEELAETLIVDLERKGKNLELVEDELNKMGVFDHWWVTPDQWKKLDRVITEEYAERSNERTRAHIQNIVREKLVSEWLTQHTSVKKERDRNHVKDTIDYYLREDSTEELTGYLADLVTGGVELADANRKKQQQVGGYVGYAWAVAIGFLRVIIVIGILAAAQSQFETIVLAILVLIYNGLDAAYLTARHSTMLIAFGIDSQFNQIMLKLKRGEPPSERESRLEQEKKAKRDSSRNVIRLYIGTGFIGIAWLYAMFRLVAAVFF